MEIISLYRSLRCAIFDEMVVYDLEDELEITSLSTSLRCTIFEEMVVENQLAPKSLVPPPPLRPNFYFQRVGPDEKGCCYELLLLHFTRVGYLSVLHSQCEAQLQSHPAILLLPVLLHGGPLAQ